MAFDVDSAAEPAGPLPPYSRSEIAERIECPTLILAGEDDYFVPLGRLSAVLLGRAPDAPIPRTGAPSAARCRQSQRHAR